MDTALDLTQLRAPAQTGERAVPAKILVVDDDELELSLMSDRLTTAGFQVVTASNGETALQMLDEQWFPLVLTDWQMPVMDGIQLIERLRDRGGDDSYFIMLSVRASREDFERGYGAGVDDYLSKKSPDAELLARIRAGFHTVELRRSLRQTRAALIGSKLGAEGTNDAQAQLLARLQTEIARARRYRRPCSVLMLGVQINRAPHAKRDIEVTPELREALMQAVRGVIRVDIDWASPHAGDREAGRDMLSFAIILPETGPAEAITVRARVRSALLQRMRELVGGEAQLELSVGATSIDPGADNSQLSADAMVATAGRCRRCMSDRGASRLHAVQASVANKVAIPCRQGYAVAEHCLELQQRNADSE